MGAFKDAQTLTALTPKRATDPGLLLLQAQDKLFSNDYGSACQIVDTVGEHLTKPYWQQLLVFCQSLQGDTQGATFGAELLAESRVVEDPAFFELVDRLTTASDAPIASLPNPKPLHLAALRTAQIEIPDDAIVSTTPAVLRTIGVSPNARLETRLEAAERAVEWWLGWVADPIWRGDYPPSMRAKLGARQVPPLAPGFVSWLFSLAGLVRQAEWWY